MTGVAGRVLARGEIGVLEKYYIRYRNNHDKKEIRSPTRYNDATTAHEVLAK